MKLRFYVIIGLLFVLLGAFLGSPWLISQFEGHNAQPTVKPGTVQAAPAPKDTPSLISGDPKHIELPAENISIDVERGYYNPATKGWTLSNTKADYAAVTPEPNNQSGNTFIYGHNKASVFAKLLKAKVGDKAIITTANGHRFTYQMASYHDTQPQDTSLFTYKGAPILTLQTCSGAWYQNRRLYTFSLVEAQ